MHKIASFSARLRFEKLLDAARRAPVTVTRKGKPAVVVLSLAEYERLRGRGWELLLHGMTAARQAAATQGLTDELLDELLADES